MRVTNSISCCGIREIAELGSHRSMPDTMRAFGRKVYENEGLPSWTGDNSRWRYAIFSQAKDGKYGDRFAAFILKNNLGKVVETEPNVNPNSNNKLKAFIWTVDHKATKEWFLADKAKCAKTGEKRVDLT